MADYRCQHGLDLAVPGVGQLGDHVVTLSIKLYMTIDTPFAYVSWKFEQT